MQLPEKFNLILTPQEADAVVLAVRRAFTLEQGEEFLNNIRMQLNAQVAAVNAPPANTVPVSEPEAPAAE